MTGSPENYKGQYAGLKFDPYKFREFPKVIYADDGKVLGTAANAREENELYASIGVVKADIDPLGAAQDEIARLQEKLAEFEAGASVAPVKKADVQTATVEMLPEEAVTEIMKAEIKAPEPPKGNPLLAGKPGAQGTAPKVDKQINPGV
jgi:hypothetical protein